MRIKIGEYRDLISAVADAANSYKSCISSEKPRELQWVLSAAKELRECEPPKRVTEADELRALRVLRKAGECVADTVFSG